VDTAKNVWACYSASCCEARQGRVGGNVLDLVAWLEGCSIRQAALRLQEECYGAGMHVGEPQRASKGSSGSRDPDRPPSTVVLSTAALASVPGGARGGPLHGSLVGSRLLCRLRDSCGNRIVFPIHDQEGPLVAYAGRSLDGGEPRYLFPPGFHKSQVVFNLHRAVGNRRGARWWWKDSSTACAYIRLAMATWWP